MSAFHKLWQSILPRHYSDVEDEFRSTLDAYQQDLIRQGLTSEEASRKARNDLGQPATPKRNLPRCHRPARFRRTNSRHPLRPSRLPPQSALRAYCHRHTCASHRGIHRSFQCGGSHLFRPLPYAHPDRLVSIGMKHAVEPYEFMMGSFFYDWRDNQTLFSAMTAQGAMPQSCDLTERNPVRLICNYAHRNLLPTLGVVPVLGRNFLPGDMLPNAPRTALLSYALWQSRYNRDPAILNQLIQIDDSPARIIGILPPDFEMPSGQPADVLLPKQVNVAAVRSGNQGETMRAFARLKPGVTIAQARAAIEPLFLQKATLDPRILTAALTLSLLSGIVCGILPAWQRPRFIALAARTTRPGVQAALRRALVVAQIACSVILLSGASLLLRSFRNMEQQRLGMDTGGVLTANITLSSTRYGSSQKQMEFFTRAEAALRSLPGVSAVAVTDALPLSERGQRWYSAISIAGKPPLEAGGGIVISRFVTPGYFSVLQIPIVRGRVFTDADAAGKAKLLILSNQLAARMFPNQDPIGQRVRVDPDGPFYLVIGIAANVRNNGLTAPNEPEYYRLLRDTPEDWSREETLIIQSVLPPSSIAPCVRRQIAAIDPATPVDIQTLDQHIRTLADRPRFETALLGFFALTGLLMAVIGLYGVIAYTATQRTQEIGVRIALGATRFNILRLITWEGARLILLGGTLGFVAALATAHLLRSLLFAIGPYDPVSFLAVAALLALVAFAATLIPARQAMQLDPVIALHYE